VRDLDKRRAKDRAYYERNAERIRSRRRRGAVSSERVDQLRAQDRDQYEAHRAAVLGRKHAAREREPEKLREQARKSYARHSGYVVRVNGARYWRGMEFLFPLREEVSQLRRAVKAAEERNGA